MATAIPASNPVLTGYGALAPHYDEFTATYDYATWIAALEELALAHGLRGRRLLDAACGTGKSFEPMLQRGYRVTACDISPEMVELAAEKFGTRADLFVADLRALPDLGRFDLITCLDDSVNYLVGPGDLHAAFRSLARSLDADGLLVFDCNSAATYETAFATQFVRESETAFFAWRGHGCDDRGIAQATIDVFAREEDEWRRTISHHVQRHHSREAIETALDAAGLRILEVRGQLPGGRLERGPDEHRHTKIVYLATWKEVTA